MDQLIQFGPWKSSVSYNGEEDVEQNTFHVLYFSYGNVVSRGYLASDSTLSLNPQVNI